MEPSETLQDGMGFWSNVPEEITARVMSFLPVLDLWTCRSVCRAWKEHLCRPGFLDLCDRKGPLYLFVTSYFKNWGSIWVAGGYKGTIHVFDLEHRRWCSLPLDRILVNHTDADVPQLLAMDDGLICEVSYSSVNKRHRRLVMFDPVAKTRRALPAIHGATLSLRWGQPPVIVTVVENSNFKVFLLSHRSEGPFVGLFLYESFTDAWRDLGNPIEELGITGALEVTEYEEFSLSAVYFHSTLYVTYYIHPNRHLLLSYNVEKGLWKIQLAVEAYNYGCLHPIVFGNRLFVNVLLDGFHPYLEVREIFKNCSKPVVRVRREDLDRMFDDKNPRYKRYQSDIPYGFAINSDSFVFFSRRSGKLVTYNMTSKCFGVLPACPLTQASLEPDKEKRKKHRPFFRAKLMNLSLQNILNPSTRLPAIC